VNTFANLLAQEQSGNPLGLLVIIIPFGLLIYLMVVPQRKQRARQQQLIASLEAGEEVVTAGGIVGTINFVEDDLVHLEVDNDVVIRVAKGSISRTTREPDPADRPSGGMLGGLFGGGGAKKATESSSAPEPAVISRRVTPKQGGSSSSTNGKSASDS
jgi:preprotein translocase subunit YajC